MRREIIVSICSLFIAVTSHGQNGKLNYMDNQSDLIEFRVASLTKHKNGFFKELFKKNDDFLLVLEQRDNSSEKKEMIIGRNEAAELAFAIEEEKTTRPLPSEILKTVITELGFNLSKIVMDDLIKTIFYSKMILAKGMETKMIDARPVDSITQSIRSNCGIFITKNVIAKKQDLTQAQRPGRMPTHAEVGHK